jgi:ribosomal protein L37AE/L43A
MYKKLLLSSAFLFSINTHTSESADAPQEQAEQKMTVASVCNSCKNSAQKVGRKLIGHCPNCGNRVEDSLPQKAKHVAKNVYEQAKEVGTNIASNVKAYFTNPCQECAQKE